MKIYLAGPMTGIPEHNYPLFHAVAARLRTAGHEVVNPAEVNPGMEKLGDAMPAEEVWRHCMRRDLVQMLACEAVAMLPGWNASRGARLEVHNASALGMSVLDAATLEPLVIQSPLGKIADPAAFMAEVRDYIRGRIKSCNKCGLCGACGVAIHLGWVKDPLAPV